MSAKQFYLSLLGLPKGGHGGNLQCNPSIPSLRGSMKNGVGAHGVQRQEIS